MTDEPTYSCISRECVGLSTWVGGISGISGMSSPSFGFGADPPAPLAPPVALPPGPASGREDAPDAPAAVPPLELSGFDVEPPQSTRAAAMTRTEMYLF